MKTPHLSIASINSNPQPCDPKRLNKTAMNILSGEGSTVKMTRKKIFVMLHRETIALLNNIRSVIDAPSNCSLGYDPLELYIDFQEHALNLISDIKHWTSDEEFFYLQYFTENLLQLSCHIDSTLTQAYRGTNILAEEILAIKDGYPQSEDDYSALFFTLKRTEQILCYSCCYIHAYKDGLNISGLLHESNDYEMKTYLKYAIHLWEHAYDEVRPLRRRMRNNPHHTHIQEHLFDDVYTFQDLSPAHARESIHNLLICLNDLTH